MMSHIRPTEVTGWGGLLGVLRSRRSSPPRCGRNSLRLFLASWRETIHQDIPKPIWGWSENGRIQKAMLGGIWWQTGDFWCIFPNSHRNLSLTWRRRRLKPMITWDTGVSDHFWRESQFGQFAWNPLGELVYHRRPFSILFPLGRSSEGQPASPKLFGMSQNWGHDWEWKSESQY